jgi:hypothetical protein
MYRRLHWPRRQLDAAVDGEGIEPSSCTWGVLPWQVFRAMVRLSAEEFVGLQDDLVSEGWPADRVQAELTERWAQKVVDLRGMVPEVMARLTPQTSALEGARATMGATL